MDGIRAFIDTLKRDKARRRRLAGVVCVLAMFVAGGVFWRLRIIGLTKTVDPLCGVPEHIHTEACIAERILICGYPDEEVLPEPLPDAVQLPALNPELQPEPLYCSCLSMIHQHDASCYDLENNLICGKADFVIHTHDNFCFDEYGALVCPLNEVFEHIHGEECYTQSDITVCGLAEGEDVVVHIHGIECYSEDGTLICELPESELHLHNELCYGSDLTCGLEEISEHIHSEECFDENGVRICEKTEILMHQHSDECRNTAGVDAPLPPVIDIDNPIDITNPVAPSIGELQPVIGVGDAVMQTGYDFMGISPVSDGINELENVEMGDVPAMPIEENSEPLPEDAEPDMPVAPEVEDIVTETENGESTGDLPSENESENGEAEGNLPSENETDPEAETPPETDFSAEAAETVPHVHTDECYQIIYSCGFEEHTHTILCYADINADRDVAAQYLELADNAELYGMPAADVCQIAASQLGYTESKQNFILDQNGVRKGYNLYSDWYTGGDGAYTDWNATFAAFCLEKAGIDREVIPYNSGVHAWTVDLESAGILKHDLEGEPIDYGDIIFFDTNGDGVADRVGICMNQGSIIYTIEGDTPDTLTAVPAEDFAFAELSFGGASDLSSDIAADAAVLGSNFEEITEGAETVKESYIWDDDKIESHTVAEVMHSYADGNIVGYVDVSEQTQSEEMPIDGVATLAETRSALNSDVPYKLYTGDYTDLQMLNRTFVIRNVASGQALGIQRPEATLEAATGVTSGATVPYTTTWHLEDVGGAWAPEAFLISTNVGESKFIACDENAENTVVVSQSNSYEAKNPNITLLPNGDNTFKMRVSWVNGKTLYYTVNGDKLEIINTNDASGVTNFILIRDDQTDKREINSGIISIKYHMEQNEKGEDIRVYDAASELHNEGQTYNYYIATSDKSKYLTLAADENGNLSLVLKPANEILQKPARLNDTKYEIWQFVVDDNNGYYTLKNTVDGRYLNLNDFAFDGGNPAEGTTRVLTLTDDASKGKVRLRTNTNHLGIASTNWNHNYIQLGSDNILMAYNVWGVDDSALASTSISLYQNGKLVYPIFYYEARLAEENRWVDYAYYPALSGNYAIVVNDNTAVNVNANANANAKSPIVSEQLPNGVVDKSLGKITNDDILWSFEKFTDNNNPHQYRIKIDDSHWLPIDDTTTPLVAAEHSWGGDGSKFDIVPIEGTNQCYIRRLAGNNASTNDYLVYENGQYVYKTSYNPSELGDNAKFELYSQFEQREDINNDIFAHWYEKGEFPGGQPNIVLRVGEKVKIYADNAGYIDLSSDNITSTNDWVAQGSYYDSYYTDNTATGESMLHSVLAIEATQVGYSEVTFTNPDDGSSITLKVTVVDNEDDYKTALQATYTTNRYHHLDVEIDAAFVIHVFRPDGSHYDVTPTNIQIESVTAKIYNTSKELNPQKDGWTTEYINDPSSVLDMCPRGRANAVDLQQYVNPLLPENGPNGEDGKYVPLDHTGWKQTTPREYGYYQFNYNANDTYEGNIVPSYTVNYFDGITQANGQYEYLTKGWGWLEFYDGDTAVLECELSYEYNGKKYYTPKQTVVMEINQTNNICPAAITWPNIQGFDISVEIKDTELFESTVFEKVDQYGNAVPGAVFEFYASDGTLLSTETTDKKGTFYFTYQDVWNYVSRVYENDSSAAEREYDRILGVNSGDSHAKKPTDIGFVDGPLTMYQLRQFLGEYFIMKETSVPVGYRKLSEPIKMRFIGDQDDSQSRNLYLECLNIVETGVMVDPNAYIKAPGTLQKADNSGTINYFDASGSNGNLYAVILKRNGADAGNFSKWTPVTGTDYEGYEYHPLAEGATDNTAVIKELLSAKVSKTNANDETVWVNKYEGEGVFTFVKDEYSSNPLYSATVKNMPGDIKEYYQYLNNDSNPGETKDSEYMIAYYYQESPDSDPIMVKSNYGSDNGTFRLNWSSTVKIPNNENRLFFQKTDYDDNLLNDTVFALYPARVIGDKKYYVAGNDLVYLEPADGYQGTGEAKEPIGKATVYPNGDLNAGIPATYRINTMYWKDTKTQTPDGYLHDPYKGQIYVTYKTSEDQSATCYINPVRKTNENYNYVGYTHSNAENDSTKPACDVVAEDGTGHFGKIPEGTYILKEIVAPEGFVLNPDAETLVEVNDYGVFAHAGTQGDGVSVGNGPGYLLSTMNSYATRNTVNETLRWIYTALRVNNSLAFPDVVANNPTTWAYATPSQLAERKGWAQSSISDDGTSSLTTTTSRSEALVTYLQYKDTNDDTPSGENSDKQRLFDYEVNDDPTEYNVNGQTITGSSARPEVEYSTDTKVESTLEGSETLILYTDVGWSALSVYQDYTYGHEATDMEDAYTSLIRDDLTQLYSNSTFVRVADRALKITVAKQGKKVDDGTTVTVPLEGAKFKIYRETKDENDNVVTTEYYNDDKGVVTWKEGIENGSELTTCEIKTVGKGSYSYFEIGGLGSGNYFLEEVEAPDGYMTLNPIPFTVNLDNAANDNPVVTFANGDNPDAFVAAKKLTDSDDFYDAASGSEQYLVTLTDDNAGLKIQLEKVAADNQTNKLKGAEFVLYRDVEIDGETVRQYSGGYSAETATVNWVTDKSKAMTFTTNDDGIAVKENGSRIQIVEEGTYYIEEIKAPSGYNMLTEPIKITVTASEKVDTRYEIAYKVPGGEKGTKSIPVSTDGKIPVIEITVPNTSGFALPQTGSSGELIYTLFGMTLMIMPIVYIYVRRRRERRAAK